MPNPDRQASSEAAWALIVEGVTAARLEAHRLKLLLNRGLKMVESSDAKDHIYQMAGDLISAVPKRLTQLERNLDRTSLALSKMGEEFLGARLSLADKTVVEEAIESAGFVSPGRRKSAKRVAARWLGRVAARQEESRK